MGVFVSMENYIHKRKWLVTSVMRGSRHIVWQQFFRIRYDDWLNACFAQVHAEDRAIHNWHLEMYCAMSTMGGLGKRVKLQPRSCKRPYGHKGGGKHKPFTRRTSRRLAKQYLANHWTSEDFNHKYEPGIGYWD